MIRVLYVTAGILVGVAVTLTAAVALEYRVMVGGHNLGHGGAPD